MWRKFIPVLIAFSLFGQTQADVIKIGAYATQGFQADMKKWQPTADYLTQQLPNHYFQVLPYSNIDELHADAARGKFDFILTHPASYIELEHQLGAQRILTLNNLHQGKTQNQLSTVIFTRADNQQIDKLRDLKNQSLMASDKHDFAGWQLAWHELHKQGFNPQNDLGSLQFATGSAKEIVFAVQNGQVAAGVIQATHLERLAEQNLIQLENFKILNSKQNDTFNFLHSSTLYPEWPLARFQHTPNQLAHEVAVTLMSLPQQHIAAKQGQYSGWIVPMNYQPVRELMQELQIGPYKTNALAQAEIIQFAQHYGIWLLTATLLILSIIMLAWLTFKLQRRLSRLASVDNNLRTA